MTTTELAEERSGGSQRPGYELAAAKIAAFIRTANLQPGDRLPSERVLGEQLGVSRTVVREAVKMLTMTGLVRARHGSGLYVGDRPHLFVSTAIDLSMPVDPEHMLSLFEFRLTLETQTARLAAERITPRELEALEAALAAYWRMVGGNPDPRFPDPDLAFHRSIAEATHNPFFVSCVDSVFQLQARAVRLLIASVPGSLQVAAEQHASVYEAIHAGNPDAAAAAMQEHVQTTRAGYQQEQRRRMWSISP